MSETNCIVQKCKILASWVGVQTPGVYVIVKEHKLRKAVEEDFPGDSVDENLPANAGDIGSIPGLGRFHMPPGNQARVPRACAPQPREATTGESLKTGAKSSLHSLQ